MSEMERASALLASLPEYKLSYVIGYIQGLMAEENREIPNAETLAAFAETDEMIRTGGGQHFKGSTADFFAMLDAEDSAEDDDA